MDCSKIKLRQVHCLFQFNMERVKKECDFRPWIKNLTLSKNKHGELCLCLIIVKYCFKINSEFILQILIYDCRFCTFLYVNSYYLWHFFLENYILAPFSYCFMKCEVSQTNDVGKTGVCVFLDVMISHVKQWSVDCIFVLTSIFDKVIYHEKEKLYVFGRFLCASYCAGVP